MMTASKSKDTRCLEMLIANGLFLGSDKILLSPNEVLMSTPTSMNIHAVALGRFGLTDDGEQPLHGNIQSSNVARLSNGKSQDPLSPLDNSDLACQRGFEDSGHRDLDCFAKELSDGIAAFDGNSEQELSSAFSADNADFFEETANGSPNSQTNSEGPCSNLAKTKSVQRSKGRPTKASNGLITSNRTIIQCSACLKTFNNSSALAKHKLIHSTERKYTCTLCSKAFKRQDHLNGHMMTHCSKKPYECRFIGCEKSYCDARSLRRHHENHHQQLLDNSFTTGSEASLTPGRTPGLTPGANGDSQSGIFRFDLPLSCLNQDQGLAIHGEIGGSPLHELSPLSPNISISPSPIPQKLGAWTLGFNPLNEPKPVRCTVCDRRFRNMPALNGHMRLHGGNIKKDVEAEKPEDSFSSTNSVAVTEPGTSSYGISCDQLSKASSCSDLPTNNLDISLVDVAAAPKQEDNFVDLFASSNISDSLINSLCSTGTSLNDRNDFLGSLAQSNQLDKFNFKQLDLPHDEQIMDQTQDMVEKLQMVDHVGYQNSLNSTGHNWTEQQLLTVASSNSPLLDGSTMGQKFVPPDQDTAFEISVSRQFQRLLQAASQLSITVPSPVSQQNILSDTEAYGHMSSGLIACTNPDNLRFAPVSLDSPACNTPSTPTMIPGKKGHPILQKIRPLTPSYAVGQDHLPPAPLHQSASASYLGNQTPCTPHSPFIKSVCSQMSSNPVFFQFPSQIGDSGNPIANHSSAPNLPSYGIHPPHTPQTPHSPYTPSTLKYTPNASNLTRHFQFPPSANFPEGSSNCGSPYPHHLSKTYHPYSRPLPASPRYLNQNQTSVQQQQQDILQVEQKIQEHIQLLQQEDLKRQQMCLQAPQDCITTGTNCKNFSILGSMFDDENLGSQPSDAISSSIEMQEYLEGIGQESGSFDVDMELTSSCPVMDSLNAINPSELSALLENRSDAVPEGGIDRQMTNGVEEVIQLFLQEQLGDAICCQDSCMVGETDLQQGSVKLEMHQSLFSNDISKSSVLAFGACPAMAMDCTLMEPHASADTMGFDSMKTETPGSSIGCSLETEKKGRKHRPEPLHIPSNVNSYGYPSQLRSPRLRDSARKKVMPYTPPPMISPARKGSGVFWKLFSSAMPQSAPPYNHNSRGFYTFDQCTVDEGSVPPESDILPHVNIGPEFQADIPHIVSDKDELQEKVIDSNEELLWDPKTMESLSEEELRRYQEFICCAPILGSGTNKEEALHLLQRCNGSTKMAILKLMMGEVSCHESNSNGDFKCKENDRWKADEIEKYHQALLVSDKDFTEIAKEVGSKSVKQCVNFYYVWKKIFGDDYRALSQERNQTLTETSSQMSDSSQDQVVLNVSPIHRSSDHGL